MKVTSVADAKMKLSQHIADAHKEPVLITKNGKPAAMLLPVSEDADVESLALALSPRFQEIIRRGRIHVRRGETIPHEELWAELEAEGESAPQAKRSQEASESGRPSAPRSTQRKRASILKKGRRSSTASKEKTEKLAAEETRSTRKR